MAINHETAVTAAAGKTSPGQTGNTVKPKPSSGGIPKPIIILGVVFVLLFIGLIIFAVNKKTPTDQQVEQETQQQYTDVSQTSSASQGVDVYSTQERDIINTNTQVDYSQELIYFTDPSTGMKMVETPNGPLLVGSAEGAAYIKDYDAKRAEWLSKNSSGQQDPSMTQANNQQQQMLSNELLAQQARINTLEQENINLKSEFEQLSAYANKQTDTITNLTNRLVQMQPLFEHSAQQSKPKVNVVLTGKNRTIAAEAVANGMAWISYEGKSVPVRVGDFLPGSNVRIKAIDSLNNQVILNQ